MLNISQLQQRFLLKPGSTTWKSKAVEDYLKQVDAFLERLSLVVHFVSGQPARGTELFSILWMNTVLGFRRSIFIEDGLVSFVTFYHKGYSISNTVKIIHRYLLASVSKIVVYYLWLVAPFTYQIRVLASDTTGPALAPPAFFWSNWGGGNWPSS